MASNLKLDLGMTSSQRPLNVHLMCNPAVHTTSVNLVRDYRFLIVSNESNNTN